MCKDDQECVGVVACRFFIVACGHAYVVVGGKNIDDCDESGMDGKINVLCRCVGMCVAQHIH